ncbi:hypothetical protein [Paucibacter soli]|uniref:hypothetical protein n=1 Tax=Paucibacter soli TaxID=3133433 RepID=UPI0030A431C3
MDINSDVDGGLPIERAIEQGNVQALEMFLHHGADVRLVPSKGWLDARAERLAKLQSQPNMRPPKRPKPVVKDAIEFAAKHCRDRHVIPLIQARLREASMKLVIEEAMASSGVQPNSEVAPAAPTRRRAAAKL